MAKSPSLASFEPTRASELMAAFTSLVGEVIRLRREGSAGVDIARAQGAADGFARALTSAGLASERDLLRAAQAARHGGTGPATRSMELIDSEAELVDARPSHVRAIAV